MQEATVPPPDDSEGINREHGAEDPVGTKTVAAPATVSGLPSILAARKRRATASDRGKADGRQIFASQETCRQMSEKRSGRGVPMDTNWLADRVFRAASWVPFCLRRSPAEERLAGHHQR